MSQSREDYIKFIYEYGAGQPVPNKAIAAGLGVSPPSVSEMILKLANESLVSYRPYHGGTLTATGIQMAEELIRKHEIWEFFLEHKLNYNKQEVHELAELLEHITPMDLANPLAHFIEYPEHMEEGERG